MIITRTPFRISFFGGGTDYPAWYRQHGGAVLATTINKYCYITCRALPPFFEHRLRVVYSRNETCSTIDEIKHPAAREVLRFLRIERGVEIHHDGDLPARSGMGSSSAFTVGLLLALHAFEGRMVGSGQLTEESIHIEQDVIGETVGSQDQVCAAHGGFNHILFSSSGEITVRPIIVPPARLEELSSSLMLFYTGIKRTAADVAESYVPSLDSRTAQLQRIRGMVDEAIDIVAGPGPLDRSGAFSTNHGSPSGRSATSCPAGRSTACTRRPGMPARSVARSPGPAGGDSCSSSSPPTVRSRCGRRSTRSSTSRSRSMAAAAA